MTRSADMPRRSLLRGGAAVLALAPLGCAPRGDAQAGLVRVATFTGPRQVTGVAVSPAGRIFVNFPRWEEDVAISVAELAADGTLTPYPDAAWNGFRAASPMAAGQRWVCVQSVTVDPLGNLWVLDPAAPALGTEIPGGPKLVRIDLATNTVARVYPIGEDVAPQGAYLNDLRFTPDGRRAVMTQSGQPGCLVTFDVASGQMRRVLDRQPSTQAEPSMQVVVEGRPLRRSDGQQPTFAADGIALDAQGTFCFWQATTGSTMYRAPVAALFDPSLSPAQLASRVEVHARSFLADGYWMSRAGALYVTSCADSAVKQLLPDRTFQTVVQDRRLAWPDSMAEGPDGAIYVTASHIPEMMAWQGGGVARSELFRFRPA